MLLRTHSELSRRVSGFSIHCIGDGPYLEELRQETAEIGNFEFLGPIFGEKLATAYASADAFIFPSLTDTFGNVVLEAQASGLPCVVMDKGGPKEIVINGRSGIVAQNEAEFVDAVESLVLDNKLRADMSQASISNARRFDKEEIFTRFWQDVLNQNSDKGLSKDEMQESSMQEMPKKPTSDYEEPASSLSYV
jgi:glycosyltransferase involved in cell wall biosynthesis